MQLNNRCLRCGSTSNLNTIMTVAVDGLKHEVALCSEHEDTNPKQAREMVSAKITEFEDLKKRLAEYGMDANATPTSGGIVIVEQPKPKAPEQTNEKKPLIEVAYRKPNKEVEVGAPVSDNDTIKGKAWKTKGFGGVARGAVAQVQIEARQSVDVEAAMEKEFTEAKRKGKIEKDAIMPRMASRVDKVQTVRGRGGQPMMIPKVIKHSAGGNTVINVVDTGGDRTLQDRFRAVADPVHRYKDGYDVDNCNLCGGTGTSPVTEKDCPKCAGTGILNKGWNGV